MTKILIATENSDIQHFGSVYGGGSVSGNTDMRTPNFVTIENKEIISSEDKLNVPSHAYDKDEEGNLLYHSHPNQEINSIEQNFVKIEGNLVVLVGDKSTTNDVRIMDSGNNDFMKIEV